MARRVAATVFCPSRAFRGIIKEPATRKAVSRLPVRLKIWGRFLAYAAKAQQVQIDVDAYV
jgi:hypothetical protein